MGDLVVRPLTLCLHLSVESIALGIKRFFKSPCRTSRAEKSGDNCGCGGKNTRHENKYRLYGSAS